MWDQKCLKQCVPPVGDVSNAAIINDNAHRILCAMWYIWREFLIIKLKHLNIFVPSLWAYQGEINLKYVSYFKALHWLAAVYFVVFLDSEGAGGAVAAEEE